MKRILIAVDGITSAQIRQLKVWAEGWADVKLICEQPDDWDTSLEDVEVVFGWPPPTALERSKVGFFQLPSSGYEQYLTEALKKKSAFRLANARGVMADSVAEHCLSLMFGLTRRVALHARQQEKHLWRRAGRYELLKGRTIAIVGLGAIGTALAGKCHALGMQVVGVRRGVTAPPGVLKVYQLEDLRMAIHGANHVALTIAALPGNRILFDYDEFRAMPKGSYFYNLARGSLVSEEALKRALREDWLAGAALDVFPSEPLAPESELWDFENILISPHAGGRFEGEPAALMELFTSNLQRYRSGQPMENLIINNQ